MPTDPEELLADFEKRLADTQQLGEQIRDGLASLTVTERSADGHITVTVDASGNLVDLKLGSPDKPRPDLAEEIMRTLRSAQSRLAGAAREAMPTLAGTEPLAELDRQYRTRYPEPAPEPARSRRRTLQLGADDDRPGTPQAVPRRSRPAGEDEESGDFGDRNLLR